MMAWFLIGGVATRSRSVSIGESIRPEHHQSFAIRIFAAILTLEKITLLDLLGWYFRHELTASWTF
jgi:hypothetical protein